MAGPFWLTHQRWPMSGWPWTPFPSLHLLPAPHSSLQKHPHFHLINLLWIIRWLTPKTNLSSGIRPFNSTKNVPNAHQCQAVLYDSGVQQHDHLPITSQATWENISNKVRVVMKAWGAMGTCKSDWGINMASWRRWHSRWVLKGCSS